MNIIHQFGLIVLLISSIDAFQFITPGANSELSTAFCASSSSSFSSSEHQSTTDRRHALRALASLSFSSLVIFPALEERAHAAVPRMDVNNALAREYTAFPGLFPTIASKIVKNGPYKNKKEVYAVLNEPEQERLKQYDASIVINKPDAQLKQFKTSQICKYECGSRVSNEYRDEQIRRVQAGRRGLE